MKMKVVDLVIDDLETKIDIKVEQCFSNYDPDLSKKIVLAKVLSWSKSFNQSIKDARKSFSTPFPIEYPTNNSIESLLEFMNNAIKPKDKWSTLVDQAEDIVKKHHLTHNWKTPVQLAIITNTLPVAYYSEPLEIYTPSRETRDTKSNNLQEVMKLAFDLSEIKKRSAFPAIVFKEKISIEQLIKWIRNNKDKVLAAQSDLHDRSSSRRKLETIYWGQVAWIILQEQPDLSWGKVADMAERLGREFTQANNDDPIDQVPDEMALRNYYYRFIKEIQQHEP